MKKFLTLLIMTLALSIAQKSNAQDEGRIKEIAYDYVLQNIESISARPWRMINSSCQKFSSGNYYVKVAISRTLTEVSQGLVSNQVYAHGAVFNVGVREGTIRKNVEDKKYYLVFVNRNGVANSYVSIPEYCEEHKLTNSVIVLPQYSFGSYKYVYTHFTCYSENGEVKWKYDNIDDKNFVIWDFCFTNKNMYAVGGSERGCYKVFSLSNGEVLYDSPKTGVGTRYTKVSLREDGVHVTESPENSSKKVHVFPYLASDNSYQERLLFNAYDKNKASDQVSIGKRYFNGDVFPKDYKKAFQWYKKAADQNDIQGILKVAECYKNGFGVDKDNQQAVNYLEKAAQKNNKEAMIAVSKMYVDGDGIPKNMNRGLYWKEKLAYNGDYDAQKYVIANQSVEHERIIIGPIDARNIAVRNHKEKNYKWAEFCIKRAIELGSSEAPLDYGLWLGKGEGVEKDYGKAEEYLTPFAENGNKDAAAVLSTIYQALNDKKKEMYWLEKAALNGDTNSLLRLADAYNNGIGVKKDKKKSAELCEKAAMGGNIDAIKQTIINYVLGNGFKKSIPEAYTWTRKMDVQSQFSMADMFFEGKGVKANKDYAISIYLALSNTRNIQATKKLAMCYLDGNGVKKDIQQAHELIKNLDYSNDGNLYYIEAKYLEMTYNSLNGNVVDNYKRAINFGCSRAVKDFERYKSKYGLRN